MLSHIGHSQSLIGLHSFSIELCWKSLTLEVTAFFEWSRWNSMVKNPSHLRKWLKHSSTAPRRHCVAKNRCKNHFSWFVTEVTFLSPSGGDVTRDDRHRFLRAFPRRTHARDLLGEQQRAEGPPHRISNWSGNHWGSRSNAHHSSQGKLPFSVNPPWDETLPPPRVVRKISLFILPQDNCCTPNVTNNNVEEKLLDSW